MVVGVRVLRTLYSINHLHTQLFHNRPSLFMFVRENTRETCKVAVIKTAGGDLLLYKEERNKKSKKMTTK